MQFKERENTYYYLKEQNGTNGRVCKTLFQNTLQVSARRIDHTLNRSSKTVVLKLDARGKHVPTNKRSNDDVDFIIEFLNSIPRYKSHYTRVHNPNKEFFPPGLNKTKLYGLYTSNCSEESKNQYHHLFLLTLLPYTSTLVSTDQKRTHAKNVICCKIR